MIVLLRNYFADDCTCHNVFLFEIEQLIHWIDSMYERSLRISYLQRFPRYNWLIKMIYGFSSVVSRGMYLAPYFRHIYIVWYRKKSKLWYAPITLSFQKWMGRRHAIKTPGNTVSIKVSVPYIFFLINNALSLSVFSKKKKERKKYMNHGRKIFSYAYFINNYH